METALPPHLRRKLAEYRFGYWSIAIAETVCVAALLISLLNPNWSPVALAWLGWKFIGRPTNSEIAAIIEARHPQFRDRLGAVIASAPGSSEPTAESLREIDQQIASVETARLLSFKPVAVLILLTIVVNVALSRQRERVRSTSPTPQREASP